MAKSADYLDPNRDIKQEEAYYSNENIEIELWDKDGKMTLTIYENGSYEKYESIKLKDRLEEIALLGFVDTYDYSEWYSVESFQKMYVPARIREWSNSIIKEFTDGFSIHS